MEENQKVNNKSTVPVDGKVIVTVKNNFSSAFISFYPPANGGKPITYEDCLAELSANSVRHNLKLAELREIIEYEYYNKELKVAEADMPVDGINGTITYHYPRTQSLVPKEDENGFVDYKSLGHIRNIHTGDVIATITLPTEGTSGTDVRGVEMKPIPGKPASFNIGTYTKVTDDGLSLVAAADGHLCFKDNAFCVETTVTIKGDVDSAVGNLDFIGDIVITGEVMEGFKVESAKNITINGNVTGAEIKAQGSIVIKKGAINATLCAGGNIDCKFCEYSSLNANGDLNIQNCTVCDVYCGGNIKAGQLNGGTYTVIGETQIQTIGNKAYTPTELTLGNNAILSKERADIEKEASELETQIQRCAQIIEFLTEKRKQLKGLPEDKEEILNNCIRTKLTDQMKRKNIFKRIEEIDEMLSENQYRTFSCKGYAYPGVKVRINNEVYKFEKETVRSRLRLDEEGKIVLETM